MSIRFEMQLFSADEYAEFSLDQKLEYLERMIKNLESLLGAARAQQDDVERRAILRRSDGLVPLASPAPASPRTH
jgi:hypothetical protein